MSAPRLELRGLRGAHAGPFDLTLEPGRCAAVTGPSGAGKSLLLRMIADLDPNDGACRLDGRDRAEFAAPEWRRRVVYNAAEPGWWSERVEDHFSGDPGPLALRLGLRAAQLAGPVARLSTGERQRLALVRALLLDPPALLLDEPTGALDEDATRAAEALLRERLDAGTAIVLVTHSAAQAARLGDARLRLEAGRFVA